MCGVHFSPTLPATHGFAGVGAGRVQKQISVYHTDWGTQLHSPDTVRPILLRDLTFEGGLVVYGCYRFLSFHGL